MNSVYLPGFSNIPNVRVSFTTEDNNHLREFYRGPMPILKWGIRDQLMENLIAQKRLPMKTLHQTVRDVAIDKCNVFPAFQFRGRRTLDGIATDLTHERIDVVVLDAIYSAAYQVIYEKQ